MPSVFPDSRQILLTVMFLQVASGSRHSLPPQPLEAIPRSVWDFAQIAASVIALGGVPGRRHLEPPQPAHETFSRALAKLHRLALVTSSQVTFASMQ